MSSSPSRSHDTQQTSRRRLLASVGTVSAVSIAGCNGIDPFGGSDGDGDSIEVLVENDTDDLARIAVYVTDRDGDSLFSRVYELEPHSIDQSGAVDARPATVSVFTPNGTSATWEYSPENSLNCERTDIGLTLTPEQTVESWSDC
ncbi:hypothetical protein [Halostella pelagica]|uniref:hypothetical protein n=1 Tax=Halostella pelagica TaxID=2583824 RepID=UPI0013866A42|nr:hypothetical protein [Halostella pelagica]